MGAFDDLIPKDKKPSYSATAPRAKLAAPPKPKGPAGYDWERHKRLAAREFTPQEVADMNPLETLAYGWQEGWDKLGRGVKQYGSMALDAILPQKKSLSGLITGEPQSRYAAAKAEEARHRSATAPLMSTTGARVGNFGADVVQATTPMGLIGKGRLAKQVLANAVVGGTQGALQPVVEGESRANNAAFGAGGAAVGTVAAPVLGRVVGAATKPLQAFTQRGRNRQVADVLRGAASDQAAFDRAAPSAIPGVQRNLAEETLDPGIAQLTRQYSTELGDLYRANNNARVDYLSGAFGGADDAAAAAIREGADREAAGAARQLRGVVNPPPANNPFSGVGGSAAPQAQAITIDPVKQGIDALIAKNGRRSVVRSALEHVRKQAAAPIRSADEAWALRKEINDLMDGRVGGDMAAATAARRELMTVRGLLDRQMNKAMPGWSEFLRTYKGKMRAADQVDVGASLLNRGGVAGMDASGAPIRSLQPARFLNLTDDLDRAVQAGTGFRRATASGTLTPDQTSAIGLLRDDLSRVSQAQKLGAAPGSSTSANLRTEAMIADAVGESRLGGLLQHIPGIKLATGLLGEASGRRVNAAIAEALANPQKARAILAAATPEDRLVIEAALARAGGSVGLLGAQGAQSVLGL